MFFGLKQKLLKFLMGLSCILWGMTFIACVGGTGSNLPSVQGAATPLDPQGPAPAFDPFPQSKFFFALENRREEPTVAGQGQGVLSQFEGKVFERKFSKNSGEPIQTESCCENRWVSVQESIQNSCYFFQIQDEGNLTFVLPAPATAELILVLQPEDFVPPPEHFQQACPSIDTGNPENTAPLLAVLEGQKEVDPNSSEEIPEFVPNDNEVDGIQAVSDDSEPPLSGPPPSGIVPLADSPATFDSRQLILQRLSNGVQSLQDSSGDDTDN